MPSGPQRSRPEAASVGFPAVAALLLIFLALPYRVHSESSDPSTPTSLYGDSLTVSKAGQDSAATQLAKSRSDSLIVVKHSFEHREQIITGSVIMSCLMLMMVAMNNYNPR